MQKINPDTSYQGSRQPEEDQNPVPGSTEEKTASNVSLAEEFLHQQEELLGLLSFPGLKFLVAGQDVYLAYHGELDSPPPDLAS